MYFQIEIVSFKGDMLVFWGVPGTFIPSWAFPESSRLPGAFYFIISLGFASDKKWLKTKMFQAKKPAA